MYLQLSSDQDCFLKCYVLLKNLSGDIAMVYMAFACLLCPVQHGHSIPFTTSASHAYCPSFWYTVGLCHIIKQVVTLCSQTLFKCSVAEPHQNLYWQHSPGSCSHFKTVQLFSAIVELEKPFLKEPCLYLLLANRAHPRKCHYQTMLNSVLFCI